MFLCPVRNCRRELTREGLRLVCALGHSFDFARSGYINLLQPQDRRSKKPGDSNEAIIARRRLHDRGVTKPLLEAITGELHATPEDFLLDVGCGEGFYLGSVCELSGCKGCGVDISATAIEFAAKRYRSCTWVVANGDRFLPFPDQSFSAVLSVTGRMNAAEFRRVLRLDGRLLVALPSPDDLIELRGRGRDRVERTVKSFAPQFCLIEHRNITSRAQVAGDAVSDVLLAIYRPRQKAETAAMSVTFSLDLLLFEPATTTSPVVQL